MTRVDASNQADLLRFDPYTRHWEDFPPGTWVETRGMTITETHIVNWSMLAGDWLPIHVDHEVASKGPFGSVIAHGPLTLSVALGLVVQSGFFGDAIVAFLGLDRVRLIEPVRAGDTIRARVEILEQVETSRPERGRVEASYVVTNQHGTEVLTFLTGFLMHRRVPA
jgi:itaconyl-CoA hydratase